jgi:hypothetical protein
VGINAGLRLLTYSSLIIMRQTWDAPLLLGS